MRVNGSLVFDASSASEIQNLRVQKYDNYAAIPTWGTADAGRLVYDVATGTLYYGTSTAWVAMATGGNATALQTEVDALETSLGSIVNSSGVFVPGQVTGPALTGSETSVQAILQAIATYASNKDALSELNDVTLTSPTAGQFLQKSAGNWVNHTLVLADVSDVTTTATELNLIDGLTATSTELNVLDGITGTTVTDLNSIAGYAAKNVSAAEFGYLDGVTSAIQTQIDGKQPIDPTLTALAAMDSPSGIVVQTSATTFDKRSLAAPAAGITISNADGVSGNPTFALANDLAALEALATTGYVVRTGDGTATTRTINGTAGNISVTNGNGGASNTDINLVSVSQAASGSFVKVTLDTFGRVSGNTPVVSADITALVDATYVNISGDTMTGALNMGGTNTVTGLATPTAATDAATKAYVDALSAGLSWKQAVVAASTAPLTLATGFAAGEVIDGVTLVIGDRILVKDQAAPAENGIYVVTAGAPTRATDMDAAVEFDGSALFVQQGTVNEGTGWTETLTVTTVGTSAVAFSQFSGGQAYVWGVGLANTGNTVFINMGAGIAQLPSDEVGIDVVTGKAVQLTSSLTGGQLTFVLDGAGLEQSASGLKISAAGVTNAMLVNSSININTDSGNDDVALGETLLFAGVSTQGVSTSSTANKVTITVADASTASKGVASFAAGDFDVTAGVVTIKAAGVDNAQLANPSFNVIGTTGGAQAIALGTGVSILGGTSPITTVSSAGNITINVQNATATALGLASFDIDHFTVTAGAVSLNATLDDLANVSSADAAATGSLLQKSAGDWVAVTPAAVGGTIALGDLQDVGSGAPTTAGQVLVADGTAWQAKNVYFLYTSGAAATSHTVTHNLGQKFCNVTVVDSTDNVVIPQSIVFNSTTGLTVTFNTAIDCKVVVMGITDNFDL